MVGVLHKDISVGNVLLSEHPTNGLRGFILDFDYSSMTKELPALEDGLALAGPLTRTAEQYNVVGKERTVSLNNSSPTTTSFTYFHQGTYYFWATELLHKPTTIHAIQHDLESFFWVLLWVILRWAKHDLVSDTPTEEPCDSVYYYGGDTKAWKLKLAWLMDPDDTPLKVVGNEPLTTLLEDLRVLLGRNMRARTAGQPITHEEVLKLFDDALEKDGWPARSGDSAVRYARLNQAPSTDVCGQKRLALEH